MNNRCAGKGFCEAGLSAVILQGVSPQFEKLQEPLH